jgi:hypothetical protein
MTTNEVVVTQAGHDAAFVGAGDIHLVRHSEGGFTVWGYVFDGVGWEALTMPASGEAAAAWALRFVKQDDPDGFKTERLIERAKTNDFWGPVAERSFKAVAPWVTAREAA